MYECFLNSSTHTSICNVYLSFPTISNLFSQKKTKKTYMQVVMRARFCVISKKRTPSKGSQRGPHPKKDPQRGHKGGPIQKGPSKGSQCCTMWQLQSTDNQFCVHISVQSGHRRAKYTQQYSTVQYSTVLYYTCLQGPNILKQKVHNTQSK